MEPVSPPHAPHHGPSDEVDEHGRHGHQASLTDGLDFVNTLSFNKGLPHEHLTDATVAVSWFQQHALLHGETARLLVREVGADDASAARLLARVQRTRAALRELLDAAVD